MPLQLCMAAARRYLYHCNSCSYAAVWLDDCITTLRHGKLISDEEIDKLCSLINDSSRKNGWQSMHHKLVNVGACAQTQRVLRPAAFFVGAATLYAVLLAAWMPQGVFRICAEAVRSCRPLPDVGPCPTRQMPLSARCLLPSLASKS